VEIAERVEAFIRRRELIVPGGAVTCLVSGGPDSTCLWHVLRTLGYRVSALHVDHGLRGAQSDADARFCADELGAEVVDGRGGTTEAELRDIRYSFATDRLRATGHTASDQVETVLYRLVASGSAKAIKPRREDGVVRPLLELWRDETEAYCRAHGLKVRAWRAGDRLAGRSKKIQDVFVDAKIPRSARESWPLVVRGDEVVAVPGIVEAEGIHAQRD
jgi:tRNA(Ile)-lysidine synthase